MIQHKRSGFTVVELIIVIVVVALLATITTIAYRSTQASARDEKRKAEALMLKGAIEEYYATYGDYPQPGCAGDPGSNVNECWRNQVWEVLKTEKLISKVPQPDTKAHDPQYNLLSDGNANYGWSRGGYGVYGIYVPLEGGSCKLGRNYSAGWWGSVQDCDF